MLVQRIKAEAKTAGGIFLPESSVKELNEAKVLAVGPGGLDKEGKRISMGVGVGDKVLIPQVCFLGQASGLLLTFGSSVWWEPSQGWRGRIFVVSGLGVRFILAPLNTPILTTKNRILAKINE